METAIPSSNEGCHGAACAGDVNAVCPTDLRVISASGDGTVVACESACNAYGSARYCCSGDYGTPAACGPTNYSQVCQAPSRCVLYLISISIVRQQRTAQMKGYRFIELVYLDSVNCA